MSLFNTRACVASTLFLYLADFFLQTFCSEEEGRVVVIVEHVNVSSIFQQIQHDILRTVRPWHKVKTEFYMSSTDNNLQQRLKDLWRNNILAVSEGSLQILKDPCKHLVGTWKIFPRS